MVSFEGGAETTASTVNTAVERVRPATEKELHEIATMMTLRPEWNDTYGLQGRPENCEKYFKDGQFHVLTMPGSQGEEYGSRLMAFWFGMEGFVGVPVLRFPVSFVDADNPWIIGSRVRKAIQYIVDDQKLGQSLYVALPISKDAEFSANLLRSVHNDYPYPDHLFTAKDLFAKGFGEAICRVNRGCPHNTSTKIEYPKLEENQKPHDKVNVIVTKWDEASTLREKDQYLLDTLASQMHSMAPWSYYGYSYDQCRSALSEPGMHLYIAQDEGRIAGCASVNPWGFFGPEVRYIFTHRTYWGKGVGKQVLDVVEQDTRESGQPFMNLTVSEPNPAKDWYLSRGYNLLETTQTDSPAIIRGYNVAGEYEVILRKKL